MNSLANSFSSIRISWNYWTKAIAEIFRQADVQCRQLWYCTPFVDHFLHNIIRIIYRYIVNIIFTVFSTIYNIVSIVFFNAYSVLSYIFSTVYRILSNVSSTVKNILTNIHSRPQTVIMTIHTYTRANLDILSDTLINTYKYFEGSIISPAIELMCYVSPNNMHCIEGIDQPPINCFLYTVIQESYDDIYSITARKFDYVLTTVVMPTSGFVFPITYSDNELNQLPYIFDIFLEYLFPSVKMTICSIQPQPVSTFQYLLDLAKRVSQFTGPVVAFKLNATVKCVQSRTGERYFSQSLCK